VTTPIPHRNFGNVRCPTCFRDFDLTDPGDNMAWYYGHECAPLRVPDNTEQIPDVSGFDRGPEDP
jgi:hypothetical protein